MIRDAMVLLGDGCPLVKDAAAVLATCMPHAGANLWQQGLQEGGTLDHITGHQTVPLLCALLC